MSFMWNFILMENGRCVVVVVGEKRNGHTQIRGLENFPLWGI